MTAPLRVIVMPIYGIGDALMATPALRNLKERTNAHITCLHMFRTTLNTLELLPYIDRHIYFDFFKAGRIGSLQFLLSLRGQYDTSINFYPSNRRDYNLTAFAAGAPRRIGHRYRQRDIIELNFLKNRALMEDDTLHNVEENLRLLEFFGVENPTPYPLEIKLSDEDEAFGANWIRVRDMGGRSPLFGFHAGSSLFKEHAIKRWLTGNFVELIRRLAAAHPKAGFMLFGGPEEDPHKEEIVRACGLGSAVAGVSAPTIRMTASVMRRASVMISNDSGLMHLSAALGRPTVGLFGPTNRKWLYPWGVAQRALSVPVECGPCFRYSPKPMHCILPDYAPDYARCIRGISVDEARSAVGELLNP